MVGDDCLIGSRCIVADGARVVFGPANRPLPQLPITIDDGDMKTGIGSIVALARKHGLTSHDAAYLELAMRTAVPLATLDKGLRKAAEAVGLVCLPPNG